MSLDEHYRILDAPLGASLDEIRTIYRDLAQVWHPDRFEKNPRLRKKAEEKLKAINEAYESIRENHQTITRKPGVQKNSSASVPRKHSTDKLPAIPPKEAELLGWYAVAALEGQCDAQCIVATMYAEGKQIPRDNEKATGWFLAAAAQGHTAAEFQVGLRYFSGGGLPRDQKAAYTWYERAGLKGHAKAQFNLGLMLSNAQSIPQDNLQACAWFKVAAAGGHPDAESIYQALTKTFDAEDLTIVKKRTRNLRAKIQRRRNQV